MRDGMSGGISKDNDEVRSLTKTVRRSNRKLMFELLSD